MMIIGLTGGIGSGKSSVAAVFHRFGVPVLHADAIAKELLDVDPDVRRRITRTFGRNIYGKAGRADRRLLASLAFTNPAALRRLNGILHPRVRSETIRRIRRMPRSVPFAMVEAALLYEARWESLCDYMVVVAAPREERIRRVQKRDRCSRRDVLRRMQHQMAQRDKITRADIVVLNGGSRPVLVNQCRIVYTLLRKMARSRNRKL